MSLVITKSVPKIPICYPKTNNILLMLTLFSYITARWSKARHTWCFLRQVRADAPTIRKRILVRVSRCNPWLPHVCRDIARHLFFQFLYRTVAQWLGRVCIAKRGLQKVLPVCPLAYTPNTAQSHRRNSISPKFCRDMPPNHARRVLP